MKHRIGFDVGGTKIAGGLFDASTHLVRETRSPTPSRYEDFLKLCAAIVSDLQVKSEPMQTLGISICGSFDQKTGRMKASPNIPYLVGKPLRSDIENLVGHAVVIENDATCAAIAEAIDGAGKGFHSVFGLIIGTGVGGGFIFGGKPLLGVNGLSGEVGHLPLPCYEDTDGPRVACGCGQKGCIEKLIAGAALSRLHFALTGKNSDARQISEAAQRGEQEALHVLDRYFTVVAKAMTTIIHSFDPEIITVSGGLNALPGFYEEVPKRWGQYAINKTLLTKLVPAAFGSVAGMQGAAHLAAQFEKSCG